MIAVNSIDLWEKIEELANTSKHLNAAIAYVSDDTKISFKKGDSLIVDASDESIASGRTSARLLKSAFENKAKLYSCSSLHAKTIVFDKHAYIGSANLSKNSMNNLDELGVISDDPAMISGAVQFIKKMIESNQVTEIDKSFIARISEIEVIKRDPDKKSTRVEVAIPKHRTWLVALVNDLPYPADSNTIESENKKIKKQKDQDRFWFWLKKSDTPFVNEAKVGDSIVTLERETTKDKHAEFVYSHVVIQKIDEDEKLGTKIYHYAKNADAFVSWDDFSEMAEVAGITNIGHGLSNMRNISEKSSRVLFELFSQKLSH